MPIVLAIEPDRRQAAHVAAVVRHRVGAELILAETTEGALDAIGSRVPDLVLVPALLSPQDDAALAAALRVIAAAAHVRTLTIPVFASSSARGDGSGGLLARFRRSKHEAPSVGCDPAVFAEQISEYLREAAAERDELQSAPATMGASALDAHDPSPFIESSFIRSPLVEPPPTPESTVEDYATDSYGTESDGADARADKSPAFDLSAFAPSTAEARSDRSRPVDDAAFTSPAAEARPDETPAFHASAFALPPIEPRHEQPRAFDATAFGPAPVEPVVDPIESVAESIEPDTPITEPVRLIAPAIVTRRAVPPVVRAAAPPAASEEAREASIVRPDAAPAPTPPLEFAEAAAIEFGERAFVESPPARAGSANSSLRRESDENDVVIDLSEKVSDIAPEAAQQDEDLFDGEPFGVYTLSLDESLATPQDAVASLSADGADSASNDDVLKEFEDIEALTTDSAASAAAVARKPADEAAWLTLGLRFTRQWPLLEGAIVENGPVPVEVVVAAEAAPATAAAPKAVETPKADHLDWSELVASLRQDIERRRRHPSPTPPTPIAAAPPRLPDPPPRAQLHAIEGAGPRRTGRKSTPVQDEWGFFDPQQCGFAALLAKLDEFSEAADDEIRKTS